MIEFVLYAYICTESHGCFWQRAYNRPFTSHERCVAAGRLLAPTDYQCTIIKGGAIDDLDINDSAGQRHHGANR
jgi:hypothetical protein